MHPDYEQLVAKELEDWRREMLKNPGIGSRLSETVQQRINKALPEKFHQIVTSALKNMVNTVITGSGWITARPLQDETLQYREALVRDKIAAYAGTASIEGAVTGAGGILSSLADFPLWLSIKLKLLTEIAALYGYDLKMFRERLYLLYTFQACFSNKRYRKEVYSILTDWPETDIAAQSAEDFDWRTFQQQYRDYIDLAKLIQMIPGVGAVTGAWVNHRLTTRLGHTAMNTYRLRWFRDHSTNNTSL